MALWFGRALFVAAYCLMCGAAPFAQTGQSSDRQAAADSSRPQAGGVTQDSPHTAEGDLVPKFNMDYFVGEWTFEANLAETPLSPGGRESGTETVRNVLDGRFWQVTVEGEDANGPFSGNGIVAYQDTFVGQDFMRYEVLKGLPLLKSGTLGCDLGNNCNLYFETPPFEHKGSVLRLKGRYFITSPVYYRVLTQISVDHSEFVNMGTVAYKKNESVQLKRD